MSDAPESTDDNGKVAKLASVMKMGIGMVRFKSPLMLILCWVNLIIALFFRLLLLHIFIVADDDPTTWCSTLEKG
jgi:hypothetical protein